MSDSAQWLEWMFGQQPPGLIWIGGHGDGWKGRTFADPGSAADYGEWLDETQAGGVYFRLTLMRPVDSGRGSAEDSSHLMAFGADLDLEGAGHKEAKLPRPGSEEQLREILAAASVPEPTAWVHSGGGRYAFWKMAEPIALDTPEKLSEASGRSSALHARIIGEAAARGYKIDNTRDLARVYRLPGTHNRKNGIPFVAKVLTSDGPRHALAGFSSQAMLTGKDERERSLASRAPARPGGTGLFGPAVHDEAEVRPFTLAEARAFCDPAVKALMAAQVGEINVRLNDAATTLAHFGEEFWTQEQADMILAAALEHTAYDGATWQAGQTIASAYTAHVARGDWQAVFRPETVEQAVAGVADGDVDALLAEMLSPSALAGRKPPRYLVKGLLTLDSTPWLIGGPGSKKSFVALDMAAHVALGKPWQGRRVNKGIAILIMGEGAGSIGKRIAAWQSVYGAMPDDAIRVLPRPVQAGNPAAWAVLIRACERLRAATDPELGMFIVVDTQARATVGLDENSAEHMGTYIAAVTALKEATGGCVLSVHHTGRVGQGTRGSSALDGAQDARLLMESKPGALEGKLSTRKQKDIEEENPIDLLFRKVTVGQDEDGEELTSLALEPHDSARVVGLAGAFDEESAETVAMREVNPFVLRTVPLAWTHALTFPNAKLQRWLLQALADVASERGLTQAEWRGVVEEKTKKLDNSTWRTAFQRITDSAGQAMVAGVVVKIHGADRWTVDQVALQSLLTDG